MCSLQIPNCRGPYHSPFTTCFSYQQLHVTVIHSSFWGKGLCSGSNGSSSSISATESRFSDRKRPPFRVFAMSPSSSTSGSAFRMNLNEYMVTLEKPLGIRFALSVDGKIFVHALKKGVCFAQLFLPFCFTSSSSLVCIIFIIPSSYFYVKLL